MSDSPNASGDRLVDQIDRAADSHAAGLERVFSGAVPLTENGSSGDGRAGDRPASPRLAPRRSNGSAGANQAADLILRHIDDIAFFLDEHGRIQYANHRAYEVSGLAPGRLRGESIDLLREEGLIDARAFERVTAGIRSLCARSTESSRFEIEVFPDRDPPVVVDVLLSAVRDRNRMSGIVGVVRNVTRRHRAEDAVRESEEKFRALAEKALVGTYIFQDGDFVYVNPRFAEITGYTRSELLVSKDPIALAHPEDRRRIEDLVRDRLEGDRETVRYESRILRKDDTTRHVQVLGTRIRYREQPALIGTIVDITRHVEYENALVEARDEAEQMSRLKTSFLANMSHEIRTPLSSILGYAEVLEEEVSPELHEFVELIRNSGERLLETLNSVLDLAQIEAGSIELRPKEFDLAQLITNTARAFEREANAKGLEFNVTAEPEELPGRMDRALLGRIVTNLVHNAVKFTDDGNVHVRLSTCTESDAGAIRLEVEDTGIGIGERELPVLFQAFRQESQGARREYEGAGLGLAITKNLIDLVDGTIEVESEKGEGTRFLVELPRHLEEGTVSRG